MAYALVGSPGAPVQSASGAAVSGLAYGQTPAAGNLLICWWSVEGASTTPTTPPGWTATSGRSVGGSTQCKMFAKIAAGGDAVPTFGAITSGVQSVQLGEFSGNANSAVVDQNISAVPGTLTSPQATTALAPDASAGELVVYSCNIVHSASVTDTANVNVNSVAGHDTNNNGTSTANHYVFGWATTTSNASADTVTLAFSTTSVSTWVIQAASFRLPGQQAAVVPQLPQSLGPGAVGPRFFAPTAQPPPQVGLVAWYAADQIQGLTGGQQVSSWIDSAGHAHPQAQATPASQPSYVLNGQNGLPVVDFASGAGVVSMFATGFPVSGQPFTVFAVARSDVLAGNKGIWAAQGTLGLAQAAGTFSLGSLTGPSVPAGWHYFTTVAQGASSIIRVDGVQTTVGNAGTGGLTTTFNVGALGTGPSQPWKNQIGEILVYQGALSLTQIQQVESYLTQKWFVPLGQPGQQSFLPRSAGPAAVGPTFFAPLQVPWAPPPIPQPMMAPAGQAITAAVMTLTAASSMVVATQSVTASTVGLTAPSQIAVTAQSVSTAAVSLTAASQMILAASAQTAATAPLSAPALLAVSAQAKTSSTTPLTAASNMTATAQSTTATTVKLTAAAALTPTAQAKTSSTAPLTVPGVQFLVPAAQANTAASAPLTAAAQLSPAVTAMAAAVAAVTAPSATVPAFLALAVGSSTQASVIITTPFVPPPAPGRRQRIQTVFVRI